MFEKHTDARARSRDNDGDEKRREERGNHFTVRIGYSENNEWLETSVNSNKRLPKEEETRTFSFSFPFVQLSLDSSPMKKKEEVEHKQ